MLEKGNDSASNHSRAPMGKRQPYRVERRVQVGRSFAGVLLAGVAGMLCSCQGAYDLSRAQDYVGPSKTPITGPFPSPTTMPSATLPAMPAKGPIKLDVYQAIVLALNNNRSLVVDKFNPPIRRSQEQTQLAVFDPTLTGTISGTGAKSDFSGIGGPDQPSDTTGSASLGLSEFLPTGTTLGLTGASNLDEHGSFVDDQYGSRLGVSITQSLLRGFGVDVNLASLHQAQIDTVFSQYELRGLAESIVAQTEEAYWDYTLAQRQIEIVTQSLQLAQKQLDEINERIQVGRLAPSERAAPEAEVAARRVNLINAQSALATTRLTLLRLISPPGADPLSRDVITQQQPVAVRVPLDPLDQHIQMGYLMRPDLNQARLLVNRGELDIVKTRNGLLPQLDLFVALGKTGYANTFGQSLGDIPSNRSLDLTVGLTGSYQLTNRDARASYTRSLLNRDQSIEAVNNLAQSVELDVRNAYIEVRRTQAQITATAAARKLQEENLRAESEKFSVGKSTSLQVAQVQRDLLISQIAEVQAVSDYLKAFVELYRVEGSLLKRRGIASPGGEPVKLTKKER